jgi:hypothetical protein
MWLDEEEPTVFVGHGDNRRRRSSSRGAAAAAAEGGIAERTDGSVAFRVGVRRRLGSRQDVRPTGTGWGGLDNAGRWGGYLGCSQEFWAASRAVRHVMIFKNSDMHVTFILSRYPFPLTCM